MKKIGLFLDSEPYSGGVFQYNQSIIDALESLPKEEYQVYVIYTKDAWRNYLQQYNFITRYVFISNVDKLISRVGRNYFLNSWRKMSPYVHSLYKTINSLQCDLWVFPTQDHYSYQLDVNAITSIHDLMHRYEDFPEIVQNGEFQLRERLFSNIAKYSGAVLVDSECGKEQVVESYGTDKSKIFVLPYVAPPYIFEEEADDFNEKYQLPDKFLFYPAQFWEHKNHDNLFNALSEVKKTYNDIKLVLVGSKKNGYSKAMSIVKKLDLEANILHLGYVEDKYIPTLYKRARALILPTFFGPTNIPPLEAMALKCPMAVSGIYGMIDQSQDAALYFNPRSVQDISSKMKLLWEDDTLCFDLAEKGLAQFQKWNQRHFNTKFKAIVEERVNVAEDKKPKLTRA
ncbi:glycosyltransferase family 4 protein [Pontibacter toksunensis]|uniref:Glycosyltransferase family 4 protein n=1 Tax=Pontibacter toksunensis TaxID=1332631 RepID=A0ABW6BM80_9BACT